MHIFKGQLSSEFLIATSLYALFIITILFFIVNENKDKINFFSLIKGEEISSIISLSSISGATTTIDREVVNIGGIYYMRNRDGELEKIDIVLREDKNYG